MRFHKIDVDSDVFAFLKASAEPFVETTPNDVLRRLLLGGQVVDEVVEQVAAPSSRQDVSSLGLPSVPLGTPQALRQILEVAHLAMRGSRTRMDATHVVAKLHNVAPQTVLDKYGRQLGLKAHEFDAMLAEQGAPRLRRRLIEKFSDHRAVIEQAFDRVSAPTFSQPNA